MKLADPTASSNDDLTKSSEPAAAALSIPTSNKRTSPVSDSVSMGRRLDVDAVLERSLRKVVTE
jgi:hypothetical protein